VTIGKITSWLILPEESCPFVCYSKEISYRATILLSDHHQTGRHQITYPQPDYVFCHDGKYRDGRGMGGAKIGEILHMEL